MAGRRRRGGASALLAPGLVMLAAVPVLGAAGGGFATATSCLVGLFALALLLVTLALAPPPTPAGSRAWLGALAAYGAFCAWNYLSILWSDVPGDAWDGANRTLLYGLVLVLVGLRPWPERAALVALALVAFGTGAVALGVLVASATSDPATLFTDGRLAAPTGYANATAAFWLIALWPALHLAAGTARTLSWPLRALALSTAALLLEIALLSQSRGAVAGFAIAALTYLCLAPHRWRAGLALGVLGALAAAAWVPLTAVREATTTAAMAGALADARGAIVLSVVVAFAAGAASARVEARFGASGRRLVGARRIRPQARRRARRTMAVAAVAVVGGLVASGLPVSWTTDRWQDFKTSGYGEVEAGGTRFTGSLGSNRYDFYRVALAEFRAHPILGIGADNFAVPYLAQRRSPEAPRYPHSLALRLLAQLGAPGAALFTVFLGFALSCALRVRRTAPARAGIVAAALAGFVMWLAHGMVDWLWEFPALSVAAIGLLALAARSQPPRDSPPPPARVRGSLRAGGLALAAVAVTLSFALTGTAARSMAAAGESAARNPTVALAQLQRAAELNFLSARPLIAQAVIGRRAGLPTVARTAVRAALKREPNNWFAHLELGLLEAQDGHRAGALRSLGAAAALNPRQPVLAGLRERMRRDEPVDPAAVEAELSRQLASKLRPSGAPRTR